MIVVDKVLEELVTQGVNALVQTVTDNVKLIRGIDSEIIDLTSDIETFNARLGEAFKNPRANDHNVLRVIVKKFRFVVDEAKDTIANYVVLNKRHGDHVFSKSLDRIPLCGKVSAYASDIKSIRAKMKAIRQEHERELLYLMQFEIKGQDSNVKTLQARPTAEKNKVFGFEKDLEAVKIRLLEASDNFVVIPIVGMTGTGKTTFAFKLFEDSSIHSNSIRIWVPVSKRCDRKQKFISIIYQITKSTEDLTNKTEEMLKDTIRDLLKDQVYFIILDDVWEKTDWDSLQAAFPNNMNGSKILVTTRHDNVVDSTWKPHNLEKLSDDDGWKLIKSNVFGIEGCSDKEFEKHGKQIAKKCNGLPLALVVVAGILGKCITSKDWERVANNPLLEINREDQSYHELVKLSYDDLPHEKLKNCFLYFAYFPMGHEIAIWKLIRLWIAEEFIPTVNEWGYPLGDVEVEAQKYLNDLVDRNLVMVIRRRADGQIKTCRIHDTLHEFCKSEAARKELFHIMDEGQRLDDENTCSSSTRRLGFHSFTADILDDATENKSSAGLFLNCYNQRRSLYRFGKHIHSLLLSSTQKSETRLAQDKLATIPNSFPLLRVLNIESINCDLLPNEVYGLYLLKYLAITSNLNLLPESFKNLRELETLVIKITARTLQIEGGIWNMEKLRHVRTNTSAQLPFPPKTNNYGGKNIRTLSTISPTSCTKEIFSRTPNLQKLGVRGNLFKLLEVKNNICLLNNLGILKCLENLKLYGQYDKVLTVPVLDKFACKLKKLSFSGTLFEWKDMAVLGKLEELEVLKLDDYAFKGENWELSNDVVFRRLQYLRIGRTNLVTWKLVTHNSFPALQGLVLQNCSSLERIPENFAKVHTLKVMELFHMSENAVKSAKEMKENVDRRIKLVITSEKREGPMTAAMDMVIEQEVSEAVDRLVQTVAAYTKNNYVKQSRGSPRFVLDSEIQDLTSDIETFSARLVEAYKNPFASVDVLIVKNLQTVVNKAEDAVANYIALKKKIYEHEALRSFPLPSNMVKLKSCESEIQSVKTEVDMIRQQHENYLQSLNQYKTGVLLSLQREGLTVFDKVIEDIKVVVNKLVQIVEESSCYLESSVHAEIEGMTSHIKTFKEKLVEACKNPNANEHRVLRVVVKKFRMLVNEAQDAVANYFALEKKHRGRHLLQKQLDNFAFFTKVDVYAGKIQSINAKMKRIGKDHDKDLLYLLDYKQIDLQPPKAGPVIHENKSLKNDLETIKGSLMEASNNLIVIAIVGMGGTGKTTFASRLFEDPEILQKFTHCIWVHVSQCFDRKQKFIDILQQILWRAEDFSMDSGDVLGDKIKNLLEAKRYFIVLDDVWEKEDWDSLKVAFPENLNGSRVLVTTRSHYLVDPTWKSHKLELLSDDDGWLIIEKKVFGEMGCSDPLFEDIGRRIAKQCKGLRLALVMVAGVLRTCTTIADWQRIAEKLFSGAITQECQSFHGLIKLGYKYLPHEMLKNCFLYFAYFPQGHDIDVWKLIRLWIAEEFIPTIDEFGYPLDVEVEAQKYFNDLVDRDLVMVTKTRADGQIKICCIHDAIHDFCKIEATRKNLFKVIDDEGRMLDDENTSSSSTPRRLCFDSSTMDILLDAEKNPSRLYLSCYNKRGSRRSPFGKHVHSLSAFSSKWGKIIDVKQEQLATISNTFQHLKVLNIEQQLRSSLLPNDIYDLYLLRYLAITANNLNFLPKSLKNFGELETLVINTTEPRLQIDGGIWNMEKLRHVHTNTPMQLPSPPKNSSGGTSIRTLCTISPSSCTKEIFRKIPRLQKLGVRGNLSELGFLQQQDQKVCLFNNLLQMLYWLENLKLHGNSEKVALKVPMLDMFASKLRKLTLCGTLFQWNDMTVLGSLEVLEVLKLDDNAFSGELWDLSPDVTFKRLKYLRVGRTNLVTWTAEAESFPVLESLVLRNCISLQNIPYAFADVPSLKVMKLFHVHERVANSAKHIHDDILEYGGVVHLLITPLPPQATEVHEQEYGEEILNIIGSDIPSTSNPIQEIVHV